jgi:hypothetical protein
MAPTCPICGGPFVADRTVPGPAQPVPHGRSHVTRVYLMGWSLGYDDHWDRDIGYGVPAYCDFPGCGAEIDRGLAYVCGGEPYGGEHGCGLYFCGKHLRWFGRFRRCVCHRCGQGKPPFTPTPDHPTWVQHKLTDASWATWRAEHPAFVAAHTA